MAEFSNAVVLNNKLYEYGDQINYFLVHQVVNEVTNIPMAEVDACCIVLNKSNEAKLLSLVDARGFSVQEGHLAALASNDFGNYGMVWIHSRKHNAKTVISTQYLVCENALLEQYQNEDAYLNAVESYGGVNDVYLTPSGKLKPFSTSSSTKPSKPSNPSGGSDGNTDNSGTTENPGNTGSEDGSGNLEPNI